MRDAHCVSDACRLPSSLVMTTQHVARTLPSHNYRRYEPLHCLVAECWPPARSAAQNGTFWVSTANYLCVPHMQEAQDAIITDNQDPIPISLAQNWLERFMQSRFPFWDDLVLTQDTNIRKQLLDNLISQCVQDSFQRTAARADCTSFPVSALSVSMPKHNFVRSES